MNCPTCGASSESGAKRCPSCYADLSTGSSVLITIGLVLTLVLVLVVCGGLVLMWLARPTRTYDHAAIGALRTITAAQSLFREGDKDEDGVLDYGNLRELSEAQLIDLLLGSGKKQGYRFAVYPSSTTPEFLWFATAAPLEPGVTGERYFCTNHAGVTYYTTAAPIRFDPRTCEVPTDQVLPVGR